MADLWHSWHQISCLFDKRLFSFFFGEGRNYEGGQGVGDKKREGRGVTELTEWVCSGWVMLSPPPPACQLANRSFIISVDKTEAHSHVLAMKTHTGDIRAAAASVRRLTERLHRFIPAQEGVTIRAQHLNVVPQCKFTK